MSSLSVECGNHNNFENWDDEALAAIGRAGSKEARNTLFMRHQENMKRFAYPAKKLLRITASTTKTYTVLEFEDIEQQIFLFFCELLAQWEPEHEPFMRFLARKMPWRLHHYVRDTLGYTGQSAPRRAAIRPDNGEGEEEAYRTYNSGGGPTSEAECEPHIGALPEAQRKTVKLKFYDDLPSHEIARRTGRTKRTVNRHIRTAMSTLKDRLVETWESCEAKKG